MLFERIDTMNATCIQRFSSWFAYNLSNVNFLWRWSDWSHALKQAPLEPKPMFLRETLLKSIRLYNYNKIIDSIPSNFEVLNIKEPEAVNKFLPSNNPDNFIDDGDETVQGARSVRNIMLSIRSKTPSSEIQAMVDKIGEEGFVEPEAMKIDIFTTALFNTARKTMSQSFAAIVRFQDVLKALNNTEYNQICTLNSIMDVWSNHPQRMVAIIDKMMKNEIIQEKNVVSWIFLKHSSEEFPKFYIWEILHTALRKSVISIRRSKKEISNIREKIEKKMEEEGTEMKDELLSHDIEKLEEKIEKTEAEQVEMFQIVFQRFFFVLTNHMQNKGENYRNYWFFWTLSHLQEIFFEYNDIIFRNISAFESLFNSEDLDSNIATIIKQFYSLRS